MTNQLAIRSHCTPGSEVICDQRSHVYLYEGGGIALNAFSSVKTINGHSGRINASQVEAAINHPDDIHQPVTRMVSLENTVNKGGGCLYDFKEIIKIKSVCERHHLSLHLDGARLFNALVETNESPLDYGAVFDSISVCLSKGLGCPVGSVLLGSKAFVDQSRRYRKVMGGGWRQAGFLAAAGVYALDNNVLRLKEDHVRARAIGDTFFNKSFVEQVLPVETNIVIVELSESLLAVDFVKRMADKNIACNTFGKHMVRFVTHLDFDDRDLDYFEQVIKGVVL